MLRPVGKAWAVMMVPMLRRAWLGLPGFVLSTVLGCGSSAPPPPPPFASTLEPGAAVTVSRGAQWFPATVVRQEGAAQVRVHYDGYGSDWDESVGLDRVRFQPEAPPSRDYRAGEAVLARVRGRLALAWVTEQLSPSVWRVRYDGFGPEATEELGGEQLRRPYAGTSARGVGETVLVLTGAGTRPAKVLAIVAADRWLVRYEGYGPAYDEEVTAARLYDPAQPAPVAPPVTTPPNPGMPNALR